MSYDDNKAAAGGQRIDVVVIEQRSCALSFGVGACTATGEPCFNLWDGCRARSAYTATTVEYKFCTPAEGVPAGYIPFLRKVETDAAEPDPEAGIGKIGSLRCEFIDAPHDDVGIDPYVALRSYNPLERGTFWPRLRARNQHYSGRMIHWYHGYIVPGVAFDLADMQRRTYVIERLEGYGRGKVTVVAKDILFLAQNKTAQWPRKSTGTLVSAIAPADSFTTLDISTETTTEYDLSAYESTGVVRIKGELIQYTGVTVITGGVRLTGVTRAAPTPYATAAGTHAAGDIVQKCAYFYDMKVPAVIYYLLTLGGSVPAAYCDLTAWTTLYDTWLAGFRVTRLICDPEGVNDIIKELIPQSNTWSVWWDDVDQAVRYEIARPLDLGEAATTVTDSQNIVGGSAKIVDEPDRIVNELYAAYGQVDPTLKKDVASNYLRGINFIDADSVSPDELGRTQTMTIWGRWHPASNSVELETIAGRLVAARSQMPSRIEFRLHRKDDDIETGDFVLLSTHYLVDSFGEGVEQTCRVIRTSASSADEVAYYARREVFGTRFARIAPNTIANGTTWATATADQKVTYMFIADADGLYSDGTEGYRLL